MDNSFLYNIYDNNSHKSLVDLYKMEHYIAIDQSMIKYLIAYLHTFHSEFSDSNHSEFSDSNISNLQMLVYTYINRIQIGKLPYIKNVCDIDKLDDILPPWFNPSSSLLSITDENINTYLYRESVNGLDYEMTAMRNISTIKDKLRKYPLCNNFTPSITVSNSLISLSYNSIKDRPIEIECPIEPNKYYVFSSFLSSGNNDITNTITKNSKAIKNYPPRIDGWFGALYEYDI